MVRRGHGDLHLGNIALLNGRPVPFDAIEFDPNVAAGDVLYDLAFLLMDLLERGFLRAANIVFNGYLAPLANVNDLDGLAALPVFLSLRAAIRAKVTATRLQYAKTSDRSRSCRGRQELFPPRGQAAFVGPSDADRRRGIVRNWQVIARKRIGALHRARSRDDSLIRSDVERKRLFGVLETERLPTDAYGAEASENVYGIVANRASHVIAANHSAIVDAVFAKPEERAVIAGIAATAKTAFRGLFLVADLQTRIDRVGSRRLDVSDATAAVALKQELFALGEVEWSEIDASGSPEATLKLARAAIAH